MLLTGIETGAATGFLRRATEVDRCALISSAADASETTAGAACLVAPVNCRLQYNFARVRYIHGDKK
jgi:hypothetical protein